jgi:hypothetical protein
MEVLRDALLTATVYDAQECCDALTIGATEYRGTANAPAAVFAPAGTVVKWASTGAAFASRFELCAVEEEAPSLEPPPAHPSPRPTAPPHPPSPPPPLASPPPPSSPPPAVGLPLSSPSPTPSPPSLPHPPHPPSPPSPPSRQPVLEAAVEGSPLSQLAGEHSGGRAGRPPGMAKHIVAALVALLLLLGVGAAYLFHRRRTVRRVAEPIVRWLWVSKASDVSDPACTRACPRSRGETTTSTSIAISSRPGPMWSANTKTPSRGRGGQPSFDGRAHIDPTSSASGTTDAVAVQRAVHGPVPARPPAVGVQVHAFDEVSASSSPAATATRVVLHTHDVVPLRGKGVDVPSLEMDTMV